MIVKDNAIIYLQWVYITRYWGASFQPFYQPYLQSTTVVLRKFFLRDWFGNIKNFGLLRFPKHGSVNFSRQGDATIGVVYYNGLGYINSSFFSS